jgi:hypothetical protein
MTLLTPASPGSQTILVDTPCRQCGYSLRSLPIDGRCPECGRPVIDSFGPDILYRCDPAWIRRRAQAMRSIFWGTIVSLVVDFLRAVLTRYPVGNVAEFERPSVIAHWLYLAVAAYLIASHWRLSNAPRRTAARFVYRLGIAIVAISTAASIGVSVFNLIVFGSERAAWTWLTWTSHLGFLFGAIAFFAYLREISRQIPSDALDRSARMLMGSAMLILPAYTGLAVWVSFHALMRQFPFAFWLIYASLFASILVLLVLTMWLLRQLWARYMQAYQRLMDELPSAPLTGNPGPPV